MTGSSAKAKDLGQPSSQCLLWGLFSACSGFLPSLMSRAGDSPLFSVPSFKSLESFSWLSASIKRLWASWLLPNFDGLFYVWHGGGQFRHYRRVLRGLDAPNCSNVVLCDVGAGGNQFLFSLQLHATMEFLSYLLNFYSKHTYSTRICFLHPWVAGVHPLDEEGLG